MEKQHQSPEKDKAQENKIELEIIISGNSAGKYTFPEGIKLNGLLSQILDKTRNTGQPLENWEIRDKSGALLELEKHLRDYPQIDQLWINPKAGIGG